MHISFNMTHIYIGVALLAVILIILWKQNKNLPHLFFFSIFWIYLMGVVSVVAFPFFIDYPNPSFRLNINLVPLYFGSCFDNMPEICFRTIYKNILLTIPFGFGINFITRIKPRNIMWLAIAVGFVFEFTQLVIALIVRNSFRAVDINDVILNATGILLGFGIFKIFGKIYSITTHKFKIQHRYIFAYIYDVINNLDN